LTNSSSKFDLVIISTQKTISYITIIEKFVERTTNVNINIGFVLLTNVKHLFKVNSAFRLKSLRSTSKKKVFTYTRSGNKTTTLCLSKAKVVSMDRGSKNDFSLIALESVHCAILTVLETFLRELNI
jgi:hypothetical protein